MPDELVIADFAASAERVAAIMDRLRAKPAYADNLKDKTVAQQSPTTDTMRLLLAALDERYGGVARLAGCPGLDATPTPTGCAASSSRRPERRHAPAGPQPAVSQPTGTHSGPARLRLAPSSRPCRRRSRARR